MNNKNSIINKLFNAKFLKLIASIYFLVFSFYSIAQQPSYFLFAENQFKGIQIYDVIQDNDFNYIFSTNDGIYYYNHISYQKIECEKAKSNSVFNFIKNNNGEIFCYNLNNQIFKLYNAECALFYEILSEDWSPDISLSISDENNLIIGAKNIIILNKNAEVINKYDTQKYYVSAGFKTNNGRVLFHLSGIDSIVVYSNNTFKIYKLSITDSFNKSLDYLKFFRIGEITYCLDIGTKILYLYEESANALTTLPNNIAFERTKSIRIYETKNTIWVAGTLPGVSMIKDHSLSKTSDFFYKNYFISDIYEDYEGNILLSTFDKGVLIIPNRNIPDVIDTFRDDPVTALYFDPEIGLMLGSSQGKIMTYKNKVLTTIRDVGKRPIGLIYGDTINNLVFFDDEYIRAIDKFSKTIYNLNSASLKSAAIKSKNEFYIGTNLGILKGENKKGKKISIEWVLDPKCRVYSIAYNTSDSLLYAATSNGTFAINEFSVKKVKYNSEDIFPNFLYYSQKKIYATDKKNGILVIKNGEIIQLIHPIIQNKIEHLNKINIYKNTIIGKSSNGFFQFDMNGKLLKNIHSMFGFPSQRIIDFALQGEKLWVSHAGGVQEIDLDYYQLNILTPPIRINKILVNDEEHEKNILGELKSNQRKVQFFLSSPTLKNKKAIRYFYFLDGYEKNWNVNTFESNVVTYNALSPGTYTFYVKSENQGKFSKLLAYSFIIAEPYYYRWWFIFTTGILFVSIVFSVYLWQLKIQDKKSKILNELNASKLTAIQSQMNPHFIFNSLNSIQDLVLKGDVENSYSYITTFSNLVRRTLNYSEKDFIDFEQEIKLLELYLSLEKLRFKKDINYEINYNSISDIMIPPLLIQPFIENAFVHGLLHKEGDKNLKISFILTDVLICTIEDNGIGREKAKLIKQRQRSEYESFSGKAIHKRFDILNKVFEGDFGYKYEDLKTEGVATGTKIILRIPVRYKY